MIIKSQEMVPSSSCEDFIQYSFQLAEPLVQKKLPANWRCPPFGKYFSIGLKFENKAIFYIYKV